ncbi:MAG: hypothetical protein MRY74_16030 [Neomegalonema sp.]|nr:hypothetical protein [Neomegalonema sp.]
MTQHSERPTPSADSARLQCELEAVKDEISAYPGPIAGCDAQFNYLLARRETLLRAISELPASQRDQTAPGT